MTKKTKGNPPFETDTPLVVPQEMQDAMIGNPPFGDQLPTGIVLTPGVNDIEPAETVRFALNVGAIQLNGRVGYPAVKMIYANSGGNEYVTSDKDEITALYKAFAVYGLCDPILSGDF